MFDINTSINPQGCYKEVEDIHKGLLDAYHEGVRNSFNSIKAQSFYKEVDDPLNNQSFKKSLIEFNRYRSKNHINFFTEEVFKKWANKKFKSEIKDFLLSMRNREYIILTYKGQNYTKFPKELYSYFVKYNKIRRDKFLPEISYEEIFIHVARFYNEDCDKWISSIEKMKPKIFYFIDEIYIEYFEIFYDKNGDASKNKKETFTYIEFLLKSKAYNRIIKSQKYKFYDREPTFDINTETKKLKEIKIKNDEGYVYVIADPRNPEYIKIGKTQNLKTRLGQYQTYTPFGDIHYVYYKYVENRHIMEKRILEDFCKFKANGEWFKISEDEVIQRIEKLTEIKE